VNSESFPTNRAALRNVIEFENAPRLAVYDISSREFVVGSLIFSEHTTDFIVFLTIARGSAAFLGPDGYGVAVIHDYVFSPDGEQATVAALRLGPGASSSLLEKREQPNAVAAFQDIGDEMLKPETTED
jgi:hypothetical protein